MSRRPPNFSARTATEDVQRLAPSDSIAISPDDRNRHLHLQFTSPSWPLARQRTFSHKIGVLMPRWWGSRNADNEQGGLGGDLLRHVSLTSEPERRVDLGKRERISQKTRSTGASEKLGTFSGVFVPTTLNVLSILMFLRFGFILGQSGVLGMLGMLIAAYIINLFTTMSISAIATNGTVRGGGAYYLISRSLGPEFGGSIGLVFYMGFVFNTGMNALGLIDCLVENFGTDSGTWLPILEEGFWWQYLWATIVLAFCTAICLAGSSIFARASKGLLAILLVATFSIPLSAIIRKPFTAPRLGVEFTGMRLQTFLENLTPRLTKGADGSQTKGKENFQNLFGILFPATGGIFAGASMSGDLKHPSKAIPKGTLCGLALTFFAYTIVILAMAASITRNSFYNNANVIQITNISSVVVLLGEFASSFFSSLMGVIGSAKLLQAIARDSLVPGLSFFRGGSTKSDEPVYAIILTFVVAQVTMLFDINRIASFITMTYLMTFLATNLACFLLKLSSAPNFRPSFHYFNVYTAAAGAVLSGISMFFVDGLYATSCVAVLVVLFLLIHYTSPPKSWGDVSQSLIYHQVRKYLLRLRQEHVKFWRPQILLFVNDIDTQYRIIQFCNSLKKGGLFVLGHVIVTEDFSLAVPEARRQQAAWTKFIEFSKVKAFTNIAVTPTAEWGIRNTVLNSGLGGMRPNIVVIDQYRRDQPLVETIQRTHSRDKLGRAMSEDPSGIAHPDGSISAKTYLTVLEDLLFKLRINVALARGFEHLELPSPGGHNTKRFIDLWPIQMSAELAADRESKQNLLTTNFDTYTLILQLGCILHTVPSWKKIYQLRVAVFVEYETDIVEERGRVEALLEKLRIEAQVVVFSLAASGLKSYQIIVNGDTSPTAANAWDNVNSVLHEDAWWHTIQNLRRSCRESGCRGKSNKGKSFETMPGWPTSSLQEGGQRVVTQSVHDLKRLMESSKRRRRRRSVGGLSVNLGMKTHRLPDSWVRYHSDTSESSSSSEDNGYESYLSDSDNESNPRNENATVPATQEEEPRTSSRQSKFRQATPSLRPLRRSQSADLPHVSTEPGEAADSVAISPPHTQESPITSTRTDAATLQRPTAYPSASSSRFSSFPIPEATVNPVEGMGPSIMFSGSPPSTSPDRPPQETHRRESIYTRTSPSSTPTSSGKKPASGFPERASIPLSFNDLPCRAQHLILNELIAQQSQETAVIFTTLPSPIEGTYLDESASEAYVSDMDVLCQGLPPCLLVHSNSMTVTMNL
ncbi:Amino acid permease domain containing protein [Elaphomyces granulatus]